jgi:hypothetical protein
MANIPDLFFEGTSPINDSPTTTGDKAFRLAIGEACRIRQDYVEKIPAGRGFKMLWTRVDAYVHRWIDSNGDQGYVHDNADANTPLEFSAEHWEKI